MKRFILLAVFPVLLLGCSSIKDVPRSDLQPNTTFEDVQVATLDGFEYRFLRAEVVPDTLIGYYTVTLERSNTRKEVWYEDVPRRHSIPLNRVARIELVRKDPVKTALYGVSMAAAGFLLVTLVEEERGEPSSGTGGGKDPIIP